MAGRVIYKRRKQLHGFLNPLNENPFKAVVTTEIEVKSEPMDAAPIQKDREAEATVFAAPTELTQYETEVNADASSSSAARQANVPGLSRVRNATREAAEEAVNPDSWLYARVAFLFFVALMITWVSPTAITNRHLSPFHQH